VHQLMLKEKWREARAWEHSAELQAMNAWNKGIITTRCMLCTGKPFRRILLLSVSTLFSLAFLPRLQGSFLVLFLSEVPS
jgi:hypothetical protein